MGDVYIAICIRFKAMNFEDKYYTITNVDNTAVAALTDNLLILIDKNIILLLR